MIRPASTNPIADLFPPRAPSSSRPRAKPTALGLLKQLNQRAPGATREGDSRLDARIASYELAARLQLSAPEVLDLSRRDRGQRGGCTAWTIKSPRTSAATA